MLKRAKFVKRAPFWSLTTLLAFCISSANHTTFAQEAALQSEDTVSEAEDKDTVEPVFRVSKLNREKTPATLASSVAIVEATPNAGLLPAEMLLPEAADAGDSLSVEAATSANHPLDKAIALATDGLGDNACDGFRLQRDSC